jgi:1-acyl-sn-glycerol-3-phosphate acyltransferase
LLGGIIVLGLALWRAIGIGNINKARPTIVCWWYQRLTPLLGLKISVDGGAAKRALLVANHISWLDVPVLGSLAPMNFLSKSEVRHWPMIGWMSAQVGTLFIKRGGNQTADLIALIAEQIREQQPVVIFPEGTTSDGHQLRRFHPRLMAAAQQPGVDVQPVAIRYGSNASPDRIAPFIDDDTLAAHLWRVLSQPETRVEVRFLDIIVAAGIDRRALAAACESQIAQALEIAVAEHHPAKVRRHDGAEIHQ